MFGKFKKNKAEAVEDAAAALEGTMPELAEVDGEEAPAVTLDADPSPALAADRAPAVPEAVRLFPGFEREDFEVGFGTGGAPALLMRWKDGGDWFRVPPMFNRAVLASMDERDSAGDLNRLLRSFGYDVGEEG